MKEVVQAFEGVVPLTAIERQRLAKLKRGAHQVIPTIAHLATKFGIEAPGLPVADMMPSIERARRFRRSSARSPRSSRPSRTNTSRPRGPRGRRLGYVRDAPVSGPRQSQGRGRARAGQEWFRHRVRNGNVVLDANGQPVPKRTSTVTRS